MVSFEKVKQTGQCIWSMVSEGEKGGEAPQEMGTWPVFKVQWDDIGSNVYFQGRLAAMGRVGWRWG